MAVRLLLKRNETSCLYFLPRSKNSLKTTLVLSSNADTQICLRVYMHLSCGARVKDSQISLHGNSWEFLCTVPMPWALEYIPSHTFLWIWNFSKIQFIWMTLIGISGTAWQFHSFSKFIEHFAKIHLCCGPSLHLYPREFKCKMWIEKDLKKTSFESLAFQRKQKNLVLEPEKKKRNNAWPPITVIETTQLLSAPQDRRVWHTRLRESLPWSVRDKASESPTARET